MLAAFNTFLQLFLLILDVDGTESFITY